MKKRDPKQMLALSSAFGLMSSLLLVFRGWDNSVVYVSLLINIGIVAMFWRYRTSIFVKPGAGSATASYRFVAMTVFWILVAVLVFFGFHTFR